MASKTSTKDNQPSELFLSLAPDIKIYIRGVLLSCFSEETDKATRNKTGDAVAEVARQLSDAGMSSPLPIITRASARWPFRVNFFTCFNFSPQRPLF